jgi:hypothetical protein
VYNTTTHGPAPIGAAPCGGNCPYDSLNVGAHTLALIGTDVDPNGAFWDTSFGPFYCDGGAGGTDTFRLDTGPGCWTDYRPMISFLPEPTSKAFGSGLTASGRVTGKVMWNPIGPVPEGGIR